MSDTEYIRQTKLDAINIPTLSEEDLKRIWIESYNATFSVCMKYLQGDPGGSQWCQENIEKSVNCALSVASMALKSFIRTWQIEEKALRDDL